MRIPRLLFLVTLTCVLLGLVYSAALALVQR